MIFDSQWYPFAFTRLSLNLFFLTNRVNQQLSFLISYSFGEKVPVRVVSKLITIVWIVIGLVLISIFVAILTVSLTIIATENRSALYGAKVGILKSFRRLGDRLDEIIY